MATWKERKNGYRIHLGGGVNCNIFLAETLNMRAKSNQEKITWLVGLQSLSRLPGVWETKAGAEITDIAVVTMPNLVSF